MMESREKLIEFVKIRHATQVRKYTNEPYFNHLMAVAEMADGKCWYGYEIGLCHDLLEDTDTVSSEIFEMLEDFGYSVAAADHIQRCVVELTDQFTHESEPNLNRKVRKAKEAERLHTIGLDAQTVKYCDLINNTESIVKYDPGFAKIYLAEKREILLGMNKGNQQLFYQCMQVLWEAESELEGTKICDHLFDAIYINGHNGPAEAKCIYCNKSPNELYEQNI